MDKSDAKSEEPKGTDVTTEQKPVESKPAAVPVAASAEDSSSSNDDSSSSDDEIDQATLELLMEQMRLKGITPAPQAPPALKVLESPTLESIAKAIKDGKCKKIIVMSGAGISVAAGIPDFRTPGTGLYSNLQKYNLPYPEAVFHIDFFRGNPQPFYTLAKELYPGLFNATKCHYFVRLLHEKGLLLRNFTQNIDTLESVAGVPEEKLVFAHGSFSHAHCIDCKAPADIEWVKKQVFEDNIPHCEKCKTGLVKPDIVFFGENLPARFFDLLHQDFPECDLLIVMGTSLSVQPFASLIHKVNRSVPRVLINREAVGQINPQLAAIGMGQGFNFGNGNYRDVAVLGDCQASCEKFAALLGWEADLQALIDSGTKHFKEELEKTNAIIQHHKEEVEAAAHHEPAPAPAPTQSEPAPAPSAVSEAKPNL